MKAGLDLHLSASNKNSTLKRNGTLTATSRIRRRYAEHGHERILS